MIFFLLFALPDQKRGKKGANNLICKNLNCKGGSKEKFCLRCRVATSRREVDIYICQICGGVYLIKKGGQKPTQCHQCRSTQIL